MLMSNKAMFYKILVKNAMKEIESLIDVDGNDSVVVNLCCGDLSTYIDYIKRNKIGELYQCEEPLGYVTEIDLIGGVVFTKSIVNGNYDEELEKQAVIDWVNLWFKKYRERVVIETNPRQPDKDVIAGKAVIDTLFTKEEYNELLNMVIDVYLQHNEVALTYIMAESAIFKIIGSYSSGFEWTTDKKINLPSVIFCEVRRMINTKGKLIHLTTEKDYLKFSEYRFDGTQSL